MKLFAFNSPARLPASILLLGLVVGTSAWAQMPQKTSAYKANDPGLSKGQTYIGINAGMSDLSRGGNGLGNFGGNQQGTAYSVSIGNYGYNQNIGFELGYTDFGSVSRAGGTTKVDGINLSLIGRLPLGNTFNLLGKLGTTYGHTDVSANPASGIATGSERGFDWSYGVGGELLLTPMWSAVLQYDEHYVKFPGDKHERVSATTLGVRYRY
jgi:OOP family OmpA-OmpF porin